MNNRASTATTLAPPGAGRDNRESIATTIANPNRESTNSTAYMLHSDKKKEMDIQDKNHGSNLAHSNSVSDHNTNHHDLHDDTEAGLEKPRRSKKQIVVAHFKRFWWVHLIIFLLGVMIVTLCLAYLAVPAIAQRDLNRATIEMVSQTAVNPTPNSFNLQMVSRSFSSSAFHPRLDAFKAAIFLEDTLPYIKPFGYLNIPSIVAGENTTINIDQEFEIIDSYQYGRYVLEVLRSETYRVALRGEVVVREQKFPAATVHFNKVVTSTGFNNLQGLEIRDIVLNGTDLTANVYIPNPSPITITMGRVTQNVYVDGNLMAYTTFEDLSLVPGDNIVPMTSTADAGVVIQLLGRYPNGIFPIQIIGNSSTLNGRRLPYFEQAMQGTIITTNLDLGEQLRELGLNVTGR